MNKLGIDIGYSTFKYIYINNEDEVIEKGYKFHKGNIEKYYNELVDKIKNNNKGELILGITGSLASRLEISKDYYINNSIALVEGSIYKNKNIKSIIEIGAQETKFINNIDSNNNSNIKFFMNSSCAAGTGSFLEEQASRLSVDIQNISEYINKATKIPRIAGRCSVFSKTDMIHHQQDGTKIEDILLGLCYALVRNYKANVIQKNTIETPVILTGGVINNTGVLKALKEVLNLNDGDIVIDKDFEYIPCFGACKVASKRNLIVIASTLSRVNNKEVINISKSIYKKLDKFGDKDSLNKHKCDGKYSKEGYLGIDIGSTSTNLVVINDDNKVIDYIYTKTKGNPKEVVEASIKVLKERLGTDFKIKGIGTTGSARAYIAKLVNADTVVNEITAQSKGAVVMNDNVDTIFEIGGQDSKYISIDSGVVKDFEMNKICAAGTGAFIEEQIKKLGIELKDFGDLALQGDYPSNLGDRCTVFIEGNIGKAIAEGESVENISSGLAYSIVKNYLNRVVGNKKIGETIFLQGGIAYNQAVVNAFRSILNKEIIVPKFFSVTGALGVAVLTKEESKRKIVKLEKNDINDYLEKEDKKQFLEGYNKKLDSNKKTVGIPRVLFINKMFPLFNAIFNNLGYNVILSDVSNEEIIRLSQEHSFEETCLPVKLINGHIASLLEKNVDYIFLPHLHTMKHAGSTIREDYSCVYMQTAPKIIDNVFNLKERNVELICPTISFNFGKKYMIKTLLSIGGQLGKSKIETTKAVMLGMKKFMDYEKHLENLGAEVLKNIDEDEKVFVILSRVYNIVDPTLNMGIEKRLKELGYKVLYLSHLEAGEIKLKKEYENMYWPFGQHTLTGVEIVKSNKNLYPIYITNHGCGPDTILSHYFKKEIGDKPYLHIEVDEHSSKVGVMTRVEAFVHSLNNNVPRNENKEEIVIENKVNNEVLIPNVYPYSNIFKVFLERQGKNVTILDEVNETSIEYGKQFSMSKEYFSLTALIAEVINKVKDSNKEYTLYLPTNEGSETFGQYGKLIRDKALEIDKNLNLDSPFIEDLLGDKSFGLEFFKAIIIGDLITLLDDNESQLYLNELINYLKINDLSNVNFESLAKQIKLNIKKDNNKKKLLIIGEPLVVYKDYLTNNKLEKLKENNTIIKQPLAEVLYLLWKDFSIKKNKRNKKYINFLKEGKLLFEIINLILESESPFNKDIDSMIEKLEDKLPLYQGGAGRYRLGKLLTANNVDGVILVSSMYENTATILKIIRDKYKKEIKVPILDLYFDSNMNKNNNELIETFTAYL
ncbi:acyl-CoA dehydratase activase [Paraclostridium bifermentans]|uniref:acyl-CoA dehydratase activase n=1 Tax=Paraclostridium bifermentans TaxID=1490 RepID=UPI001FF3C383|nr:acyl-CoA dehydratase activase [Paraclostridium bifermentans]UOW69561.1 acyl-CoA dehydratase activase [Paraclostridium bifermentans]